MTITTLAMTGWTIDKYEAAYGWLHGMDALCDSVANEPSAGGLLADEVEGFSAFLIHPRMTALVERLRAIHFDDQDADDRRTRVLLQYELHYPELTTAGLIQMMLQQAVRQAV